MEIRTLLELMVKKDASDIYLTVGLPPTYRVEGSTRPMGEKKLSAAVVTELCQGVMDERQKKTFAETKEMNLALSYQELGRFRVNIFQQRGHPGMVIRQIKLEIMTIDKLGLPAILKDIVMTNRGMVLVVGATGSGKSTTLAAMVDHRNSNASGHIISIEDPVEYVHSHKRCVITQREVGFDTVSFQAALKNTLRQAPDVILIGEIRDTETMEAATTFAETGHLCLGTLHSNNANQAIERILNFFPEERHPQIYLQLSLNLRSIISQRLIKTMDGRRTAALEIMMDTPRIKDLIKKAEVDSIKEAMEQGEQEGCQTFDRSIFDLYMEGQIDLDQALANADSTNNLRLRIQQEEVKRGVKEEKKADFRIRRDVLTRN
ncbi:PilT/PilU family type 4a pilus ATPase [Acidobacteria bacterium AH-259-A15]|nr:PilT/PilU family type 4a pilus ATPase [Acidobacteria bacterium AH-259-A15]